MAAARKRIGALLTAARANPSVLINGGESAKTVVCAAREFNADGLIVGRQNRPQ
jgi:hypothetical protein